MGPLETLALCFRRIPVGGPHLSCFFFEGEVGMRSEPSVLAPPSLLLNLLVLRRDPEDSRRNDEPLFSGSVEDGTRTRLLSLKGARGSTPEGVRTGMARRP